MIITIDGPVATGKSTIAKKLARSIGYIYFDTGAMYRSITYGLIKHNISIDDPEGLKKFLDNFTFDIKIKHGERAYFLEGEDITDKIRSGKVTGMVSKVSAHKEVREKLVSLQRELSQGVNAVFEGRDMGTVVFPKADIKVFLTGRPEVRARRRFEEFKNKYPKEYADLTLEEVLKELNDRDYYDSTREISPLKQADDAVVIDTSDLTPDEVVLKIQEYKDSRRTRLPPGSS